MIQQPPPASPNSWFEDRRHLFVKNMLKGFYETHTRFIAVYEHYSAAGEIPFAEINRLVGTETDKGFLWNLKDRCHKLWRDTDPQDEMSGCLLDWIIGSIFHEAMKLKENTYMYQFYGPLAESMKKGGPGKTVRFCGEECQRLMDRTRQETERQMENLGFLFGRANYLTRIMLRDQGQNLLLVRYLVENSRMVQQLWSESLEELLSEMFPEGPEYGYCAAARSYLEGDWHGQAMAAYQAALAINPACEEAQRRIYQLQALLRTRQPLDATSRQGC